MKRFLRKDALADLVSQHNLVLRPNKRSYILRCPVPECGREKLYVEKATGRGICFHCGLKGWADRILARSLSVPENDLTELLYGDSVGPGTILFDEDLDFEDWWHESNDDELVVLDTRLPPVLPSPSHRKLDGSKGETYLASRGISLELAKEYGVTYDPAARRVVFPVKVDGELVGWQARTIVNEEPKILTQGEIGGKVLMFQDRLVGSDHAILAEGPIDAIKCHLAGGNVASMGKGVTREQIDIIFKGGIRKLYIGLDPDAADDIMRVVYESGWYDGVKLFLMEPPRGAKDLGEITPEAAYEIYRSAPRIIPGQLFVHF